LATVSPLIQKKLNTDITFYCFRHTFSDTLERLEVDERIIERLTEKLPKSSIKHYTHRDLIGMKEAVEKLPKLNSFILLSYLTKTADSELPSKTAVYV